MPLCGPLIEDAARKAHKKKLGLRRTIRLISFHSPVAIYA